MEKITTLFCDVGGVLLTNGWGHASRVKAAKQFDLDANDFETRHQLIFDDYETGKISLDEYLRHTVFYTSRSFSYEDFIEFMYDQSQPFEEMLDLIRDLKKKYHLKVVILSNEGRELTEYRFDRFDLTSIGDIFLVSSFVGIRKPDQKLFQMALDIAQALPEQVAYIDDRELFIEIAREMGIQSIKHTNKATTQEALNSILDSN